MLCCHGFVSALALRSRFDMPEFFLQPEGGKSRKTCQRSTFCLHTDTSKSPCFKGGTNNDEACLTAFKRIELLQAWQGGFLLGSAAKLQASEEKSSSAWRKRSPIRLNSVFLHNPELPGKHTTSHRDLVTCNDSKGVCYQKADFRKEMKRFNPKLQE